MSYRKKLIEVALPLEAINAASAREKSIRHGHPSTLHLWWARRPLAACRAVIFASLVDDPNDPDAPPEFVQACRELPRGKNAAENDTPRQRLFDFIETLVQWESTTDEQVLETARELIRLAIGGNPPPLLDPFAGGGSIPLEAQRLGLEAHASDLNPVAVMICKALIEIPPRFANRPPVNPRDRQGTAGGAGWKGAAGLAADVRYYGEWMRDRAWERIGHLYPKCNGDTVIAWLWARTVRCPNPVCGAQMPLVSSFWLSRKRDNYVWLEPIVNRATKEINFKICSGQPTKTQQNRNKVGSAAVNEKGNKVRATFQCLCCGQGVAKGDYIDQEADQGRMAVMPLVIVVDGPNGRAYRPYDKDQIYAAFNNAPSYLRKIDPANELVPTDPARGTFASNAQGRVYGFKTFGDYFTPRQLVALLTLVGLLSEVQESVYKAAIKAGLNQKELELRVAGTGALAYAQAVRTYLAMAVSRLSDIQNALCRWENTRTQVRNLFSRQAIPMLWDFAENNLFADAAGDFSVTLGSMLNVVDNLALGTTGIVHQKDAQKIEEPCLALVSTDPPYYDNISYADLSDFFYIWLRRGLRDVYPGIFGTLLVPKSAELTAERYRFNGDQDRANRHFEDGLYRVFRNVRSLMHPGFPLTTYYAFKQEEIVIQQDNRVVSNMGWETMLESLIYAKFVISGTWPMRTELSNRPVASLRNALASSIVLVCHPRPDDAPMASRREFVNALRKELPVALREMQSGNIAPVDMAQASIGPGMAVYSRYSKVLEPDGRRLTVRTALQLINHELDAYLAEQEGYIDEDSRFAVAWFEQFGFKEGPFGQADVLARAKNTSVDGLAYAGVLESGAGKVRLYHWTELDAGWDPTTDKRLAVWEAVHHLVERLNTHGEEGAAMLLARMPPGLAAEARQLAYRLYSICERKDWAEHARDYNALVISWSASQEQAREFRDQYQQGELF